MEHDIRPATPIDAEAMAAVHVAAWRDAYKNIVPTDYLTNLDVVARSEKCGIFNDGNAFR